MDTKKLTEEPPITPQKAASMKISEALKTTTTRLGGKVNEDYVINKVVRNLAGNIQMLKGRIHTKIESKLTSTEKDWYDAQWQTDGRFMGVLIYDKESGEQKMLGIQNTMYDLVQEEEL